nr:hypothetical protein [Tanacetum cinerariifolium]
MAFVPSSNNKTSSTNGTVNTTQVVNTAHGVSTVSTQVNVTYSINIDNLSGAVISSFCASQPNTPQLVHEDLEQIHPDEMKEMDLRWQMAMLTMRARRSVLVKTSTSTTLVSCEGLGGYDWSDQIEEGPNYALLAFSSSSSILEKSELMVLGYKTGLKSVKERLEFYKTNESIYFEDIKVLKVEIQIGEIAIREHRKKLQIAQKIKMAFNLMLGYDNYNEVPHPYIRNSLPPTPDLSSNGLDKFANKPVVEKCKAKSSEEETKIVRKNYDALFIEEWVSDNLEEDESQPKIEKKTVKLNIAKIEVSTADDMDQDSAHMVAASKVLMLKPENGVTLVRTQVVDGVTTVLPITTAKQKAQRRLKVKARSTLMMGIPNEHQLKFNSITDAKQLLEAIEKRFDESSLIGVSDASFLALQIRTLIIVSTYRYPIQVLVIVPLNNLEFSKSDDFTLRVDIASRLPVDSKTIELLTFAPLMGDSPESMLVVAYQFLNPHCPRHQVFNPLDVLTSSKKNSSSTRLLHDPFISSQVRPASSSGVKVSLSRFIRKEKKSTGPAKSCSNHDLELEVSFVEKTIQDAKKVLA